MGHRILGVGLTGTSLTTLEKGILRDSPPYAVILFGRNVGDAGQLRDFVAEIKSQSSEPPLVLIDEEGGRVDRLREILPGLPSAESFVEIADSEELVGWFGRIIGQALRYFDIDVNLAPVVDLNRGEAAKGLERRCFGPDAQTVVRLAGAFLRNQHDAGVASCLKHFPGLGLGSGDPHYGASVVDASLETLVAEDLIPYADLGNEAGAVVIGHGIYPRIDPAVPATLSHKISTDLLRGHVGFSGLAISDDMEMHAVSDLGSYEEICERALMAGNDILMLCSHVEVLPNLMDSLESTAARRSDFSRRVDEAVERAEVFRLHCGALREGASVEAASFEDLLDELDRFCEAFNMAKEGGRGGGGSIPRRERRNVPRKGGTGRTGREEWT